jgi:prephenate dehydrogenase
LEILIIGVGEMGKLFSSYLSEEHQVAIYDLDRRKVEEIADERIKPLSDLSDLKDFESALLCVPISKVPGLVEELSGKMRKGSVIMEISSVKSPVIGEHEEAPEDRDQGDLIPSPLRPGDR